MSEPYIAQIRMFAGNFAPRDHALCNGALLQVAQNTALFSILGVTFGGDGRTTFGLPDLASRAPMHQGRGPGLTSRRLGERVGSETVTLSAAQLPNHTHALRAAGDVPTGSAPAGQALASATVYAAGASGDATFDAATIGSAGGGAAHDNVQPFRAINFIIALNGIYPSRD